MVFYIKDNEDVFVLVGDVLFICEEILSVLKVVKESCDLVLFIVNLDDFIGMGCIICENDNIIVIVEYKDVIDV